MNLVFTFDDGRQDNFEASKILDNYSFVATFFVTTGFIDGTLKFNCFGNNRHSLNVDQIKEMNQAGHEIASHGNDHVFDSSDFKESFEKIHNWLFLQGVGFSIPNSSYDISIADFIADNKRKLLYIRTGRNNKCYSFLNKCRYFVYHYIIKLPILYRVFNKANVLNNINKFNINSIVIKKDIRITDIMSLLNKYKNTNCSIVFMFHSIVDEPSSEWEYSKTQFIQLCNEIAKCSDFKVLRLKDLIQE